MYAAIAIVEAGRRLRELAILHSADLNEAYFMAHCALVRLIDDQRSSANAAPSFSLLRETLEAVHGR